MRPVKEYYEHWLPSMLGASATTIGHNIFYDMSASKVSRKLRKHETIHVEQCERYTTVGFFIIYFYYYVVFRLKGQTHWEAYKHNPLEIEAFARESEV